MDTNSTSAPIKTGLLAYGMSGKVFHAPFLYVHPAFELYAVTERTKKLAAVDYPELRSYSSVTELLEDPDVELVIVNTPNYLHYEHTKAALLANKHVLVEKPFTANSTEAKELFALAKERNLFVMVYQNRRYSSDFLSVQEVLNSGVLGNVIELNFRFDRYKYQIGPKKFKEEPYPASGILYDLGAHILDQIISLYGRPSKFNVTSGIYRPESQVPDFGHFHLRYSNQINAFITISMMTADPIPGIVINGTKGTFIKPFSDTQEAQSMAGMLPNNPSFGVEAIENCGKLTIVKEDGTFERKNVEGKKGNMLGLFEDVYQQLRNGKAFPVTEDEILIQLEILEESIL